MSKRLNAKGFSAVEVLLVLILIAIVGFTGFYVWNAQRNANKTLTTASQTASNSSVQATKVHTAQEAATKVQSAYSAYVTAGGDINAQLASIKPFVTTSFYTQLQKPVGEGVNPVVCAQALPDSYIAEAGPTTGSTAMVNVSEVFGADKVTPKVTVNLSTLLITNIACQ